MDRRSIVRRIQASRRDLHSRYRLQWIIRDVHLVVLGINFGSELVLLQAFIDDAQRLFLDADRRRSRALALLL
jgi:hypothetical protein